MRRLGVNRLTFYFTALTIASLYAGSATGADSGTIFGVQSEKQQLVVRSLDLGGSLPVQERAKFPQPPGQRLSAIFQNTDGTIGVVYTLPNNKSTRVRVRNIGTPKLVMDVSATDEAGLESFEALSSLLIPSSGPSNGLVSHYSDTPPFSLVALNVQPGQLTILKRQPLNPEVRYAHLAQCPDGSVYATAVAPQYDPTVVKVDVNKQTVTRLTALTYKGNNLTNDVRDLACGPSGQLYALDDPTYSGTNSLFAVNLTTGVMTLVQQFDVDRFVFVH